MNNENLELNIDGKSLKMVKMFVGKKECSKMFLNSFLLYNTSNYCEFPTIKQGNKILSYGNKFDSKKEIASHNAIIVKIFGDAK